MLSLTCRQLQRTPLPLASRVRSHKPRRRTCCQPHSLSQLSTQGPRWPLWPHTLPSPGSSPGPVQDPFLALSHLALFRCSLCSSSPLFCFRYPSPVSPGCAPKVTQPQCHQGRTASAPVSPHQRLPYRIPGHLGQVWKVSQVTCATGPLHACPLSQLSVYPACKS